MEPNQSGRQAISFCTCTANVVRCPIGIKITHVFTQPRTLTGHNEITREQRGCVLIENWASASGGGGGSINYVDKITGEWVQVWNGASGSQINIRGGVTEEGMLLVGTIHYVATEQTLPFRGLWTLLEDGRVRQFLEQSNDSGATRLPWFEGFYTRVGMQDQE